MNPILSSLIKACKLSSFTLRMGATLVASLWFYSVLSAQDLKIQNQKVQLIRNQEELPLGDIGGLTAPVISKIDINGDGLDDLFVFDRHGAAMFWLKGNKLGNFDYVSSSNIEWPPAINWVRLVDLNMDSVPDAITSSDDPYKDEIRAFIGTRSQGILSFEPVINREGRNLLTYFNGVTERTILVNNKDLPGIADIDHDGDIDLLTFNSVGTYVQYYKNITQDSGWTPSHPFFVLEDECWGKFYEDGSGQGVTYGLDNQTCASGLTLNEPEEIHNGATLSLIDPDNDGDQDLLFGDPGSLYLNLLYNWGSRDSAFIRDQEIKFPDRNSASPLRYLPNANVLDLDDDGDQDVLIAPYFTNGEDVDVIQAFMYDNDHFVKQAQHPLEGMLDVGSFSHPASIDFDGDGWQDLVLASGSSFDINAPDRSRLSLYRNTADGRLAFELVDSNWLGDILTTINDLNFSPTFGDLDDDGDQDLMMGSASGKLYFLENKSEKGMTPAFDEVVPGYSGIDIQYLLGTFSNVCITDINDDGLNDLLVGSFKGDLTFFRNIGMEGDPKFDPNPDANENTDQFGAINPTVSQLLKGNTSPVVIRIDGERVIAVGDESGRLLFYSFPDPNANKSELLSETTLKVGQRIKPLFGDFNKDGTMDILTGNKRGGISGFELKSTTEVENPNRSRSAFLFPNPVKNELSLGNVPLSSLITIHLSSGQTVFCGTYKGQKIDVNQLNSGCYLLSIKNDLALSVIIFIKE